MPFHFLFEVVGLGTAKESEKKIRSLLSLNLVSFLIWFGTAKSEKQIQRMFTKSETSEDLTAALAAARRLLKKDLSEVRDSDLGLPWIACLVMFYRR